MGGGGSTTQEGAAPGESLEGEGGGEAAGSAVGGGRRWLCQGGQGLTGEVLKEPCRGTYLQLIQTRSQEGFAARRGIWIRSEF